MTARIRSPLDISLAGYDGILQAGLFLKPPPSDPIRDRVVQLSGSSRRSPRCIPRRFRRRRVAGFSCGRQPIVGAAFGADTEALFQHFLEDHLAAVLGSVATILRDFDLASRPILPSCSRSVTRLVRVMACAYRQVRSEENPPLSGDYNGSLVAGLLPGTPIGLPRRAILKAGQ